MLKYIITFVFSISYLFIFAQEDIPVWKKLRYLSEEEMYMEVRSSRNFVETDPPEGKIRNVAEFDPMQGVLARYPFGVPITVLKEIAEDVLLFVICQNSTEENEVINTFENSGVNLDNCRFLHAPTNSWWVRDYGPWFVFDGDNKPGIVDFPYNRPRPRDNDIPAFVAEYLDIDLYGMNILHTGGNYMTDGLGKSSSTDLITEENPGMSEDQINSKLREYLDIESYYILPDPLDDYIKHIDCWGKFLTPGKVIVGQVPDTDYRYEDFEEVANFFANTTSSYGVPFEVHRVYTPGMNQTTPYTNSLIVNNKVFVPISGSQWDDEALASYEVALPGYEIIGIYHWGWYNTDALHCRTKGVADFGMLYLDHNPILGARNFQPSIEFIVDISAYSGMAIHHDSVFLHYSINEGDFEFIPFTPGSDDLWNCTLNNLKPNDQVHYYIEAKDQSGRTAMHPFIGAADPHEFSLGAFVPELSINPDTLVFDNYDKLIQGLEASVFNNLFSASTIMDIDLPNNPDYNINISNVPALPYEIGATSTINFTISFIEPLPEMGSLITDSVVIKTEHFSYPVIFRIDRTGVNTFEEEILGQCQVFPNPVSEIAIFQFSLKKATPINLQIYDQSGKLIYSMDSAGIAGEQKLSWDLGDASGNKFSPGSYFYRLNGNQFERQGKLIIK